MTPTAQLLRATRRASASLLAIATTLTAVPYTMLAATVPASVPSVSSVHSARAAPQNAPDFDALAKEATSLLQEYIRVDTTNPPGNERRAADFFKKVFDREGIPCEILDMGNNRANVVAHLAGSGKKRPLVLLNHLDVVPVDAARWTVPPFAGEIRDGYVWGRGATDMKGTAIAHCVTMLALKRSGAALDRDVVFLGTADEEEGVEANGAAWVIRNRRDVLRNAELVLTEGAYIDADDAGRAKAWNVDVTEKSVLWLKVTASGRAGHGSIPEPNGAVAKLVRAMGRLIAWEPEIRLIPAVEKYFQSIAANETGALADDLRNPRAALADPARRARLLADPFRSAALRATVSVTGLKGSDKVNVIPGETTALIDCRLLPGDDAAVFLETLKKVAGEPDLKWEIIASSVATESTTDTDLFRSIERARDRFDPGVPVLTPPLLSTTDATTFRQAGLVIYGFEAWRIRPDEDQSHGDDERLSLANIRFGVEAVYFIVWDVCGAK